MSDFHPTTSTLARALLDPAKHVNFAEGMVLGADEFNQEFAHLSGRDQWLARDALGHGTVSGLRVRVAPNPGTGRWEVVVDPGVALTPSGQWVRVARQQFADLADWIAAHPEAFAAIDPNVGMCTENLRLMLEYRESLTDPVPVLDDACRTDQDLHPSRITDDFLLSLVYQSENMPAPEPREEEAVCAFVEWLHGRIHVAESSDPHHVSRISVFLDELRQVAASRVFPPHADSPSPDSWGENYPTLTLSPVDAEQFMREALRVWIVEMRGLWHPARLSGSPGVLLAVVRATITFDAGSWRLIRTDEQGPQRPPVGWVDESARPWLLHARMLQELVLQQMKFMPGNAPAPGNPTPNAPGLPTQDVNDHDLLTYEGSEWVARPPVVPPPGPGHIGHIATYNGSQFLPQPSSGLGIGGDVVGTLGLTSITSLQGRPVNLSGLQADQVLAYDGATWRPTTPDPPPASVQRPLDVADYMILAAGQVPVLGVGPVVGTSNLKVTAHHTLTPVGPGATYHHLVEFTYDLHQSYYMQAAALAPARGFIVKATLMTLAEPLMSPALDQARDAGLDAFVAHPALSQCGSWWSSLGSVTIALEFISRLGIVLRVTTPSPPSLLADAYLMVEVSWCRHMRTIP